MSTQLLEREGERTHAPRLIHLYRYGRAPLIGDVALCGWVKVSPRNVPRGTPVSCNVCAAMNGTR